MFVLSMWSNETDRGVLTLGGTAFSTHNKIGVVVVNTTDVIRIFN